MGILLYDLAAADDAIRPSPFCWRTKFALAHKGLSYETIPVRFTEKQKLPEGHSKVPVIDDNGRIVGDSWDIAVYLEETYADRPSLFGGPGGVAHARFINTWADQLFVNTGARHIILDIWTAQLPADAEYFRTTREKFFGASFETLQGERETAIGAWREQLLPLRLTLRRQKFLGGAAPSYADYIVFGPLQWARIFSDFDLLAVNDPLNAWRERMMGLFDGLAGTAKLAGR